MSQQNPARQQTPNGSKPTDVDAVLMSGGSYRSLSEQKLSAVEEKFERIRRTGGLFAAPLVAIVLLIVPMPLPYEQQTLIAVLVGVVILWLTEAVPIPIGGLIGIVTLAVLQVAPADEIVAPFGSTTIFTFIGAFLLAQAMMKHGIARRFAFTVLSLPGVGTSTFRIIVAFGVCTALLSAFVSSTATVAMLLPTAIGILATIAKLLQAQGKVAVDFDPLRLRVGAALMLMLTYAACIGGLLTPVGTPPNLIGRGLITEATGREITFAEWIAVAAPMVALIFVPMCLILFMLNKPELKRIEGAESFIAEERRKLGSWTTAQRNVMVAFIITVTLWILPGITLFIAGPDSAAAELTGNLFNEGMVACIGASLLYVLPSDWGRREFTMTWGDAAKIDWGTILLFGEGIIIGSLLESTGLAATIGEAASAGLGLDSIFLITAFGVVLAILISETTSNTASAAVVVPIVIPIAMAAGVNPLVPALAATFACSAGFMLPVSTPPNAIVYGSGAVPIGRMVRTGIFFDIILGALIIVIVPFMARVVGLA